MKIYIRKLDKQCLTHQISIPKYVVEDFFDGVSNNTRMNFKGKKSGVTTNVTMLTATDPRLGGGIKELITSEKPMVDVNDLLVIYKGATDYTLEIVDVNDTRYQTLLSLYTSTDRHIFVVTGSGAAVMVPKKHELNQILYGAPGTGKTYSTALYALAIIEDVDVDSIISKYPSRTDLMNEYRKQLSLGRIKFTTFHQNYSYEDFIQGLRPDKTTPMKFIYEDGLFKAISDSASKNNGNYVLIIDEINRANISKVFGELITLIEPDKRKGEVNEIEATLPSGDSFSVPSNLYILGTMNSADKSISLIDAALRRRFKFIEVAPDSSLVKDPSLKTVMETLNEALYDQLKSTDLLVGHAYFMNRDINDLGRVMNDQIIPLLYEYCFDNRNKVKELVEKAIKTTSYKVDNSNEKVRRLRITK